MDKFEIRRLKLLEILRERHDGVHVSLAAALEVQPDYLSRMLYPQGKKGKKNIGDKLVGRIQGLYEVDMSGRKPSTSTQETKLQRVLPDEDELLELYRTTDEAGRERILRAAREVTRMRGNTLSITSRKN